MTSNSPKPDQKKKRFFTSPNVMFERLVAAPRALLGGLGDNSGSHGDDDTSKTTASKAPAKAGVRHLRNIFAVPMSIVRHVTLGDDAGSGKSGKTGKPAIALPSHKHEKEEIKFFIDSLKDHYLFETLPEKEFQRIAQAFELIEFEATTTDDTVVIKQGERVTNSNAYFYLLYEGRCAYEVNNEIVGDEALPGDCFGELALLYNCPRAATVKAQTTKGIVKLFRIHQTGFRQILQQENLQPDQHKYRLIDNLPFVSQMLTAAMKEALTKAMLTKVFEKGDYISKKGDIATMWGVIEKGTIRVANIGNISATSKYEDVIMEHGECFGELFLYRDTPMPFDVIAETDGVYFTVDKETFINIIGGMEVLKNIARSSGDVKKLRAVPILSETIQGDNARVLTYLASCVKDEQYPKGHSINLEGFKLSAPALYLVRGGSNGKIRITSKNGDRNEVIGPDFFFGDDQLLSDMKGGMVSGYTATVIDDDITLGVLKLESCRKVVNTRKMGNQQTFNFDSLKISGGSGHKPITLNDLHRHKILGAGTFGQVWLVSRAGSDGAKHAYALKVQSKYELVENGQARGVIYEKQIMSQMSHPFVGGLVASFQDTNYVYMVMSLIQGGELYGAMHTIRQTRDMRVLEKQAIFYIACIAEGLTYMHRRGFVYRDLKPENVLVDADGYPVIIDFGFAKFVLDKTFTLCGTPLYIAPEVILNRGHNYGADHWSLGCLAYEMLAGKTPFYNEGMDQSDLFKAIIKGQYDMPKNISIEAQSFIDGLLKRNPAKRLGNLQGGFDDLLYHPWLRHIDHDALLLKEFKAPVVPNIKDPFDGSNFDDWSHVEDKTKHKYPALKEKDAHLFDDFLRTETNSKS